MDTNGNLAETQKALERSRKMADTLNKMSAILLSNTFDSFDKMMTHGMGLIADMADLDTVTIWRNHTMPDGLYTSQIYCWDRQAGGTTPPASEFTGLSYNKIAPRWEALLSGGEAINGPVKQLPEGHLLSARGVASVFITSIFIKKNFWGFVIFCDSRNERYFDSESSELMQSAAFLSANAIIRADMEKEISQSQKFNQTIIGCMPFGLTIFDENIRIIDCNEEILKILGTTKQQYIDHFFDFSQEYQWNGQKASDMANSVMKNVITSGETVKIEWNHISATGEIIPCDLTVTCVEIDNKYTGFAFAYDLRKIRKMEEDILRAARINNAILENLPIGMATFDDTPKVTNCNKKLAEMFNAPKQQLIDRYFEDFSPKILPDGRNALEESYKIMNRAIAGETVRTEWPHQTAAGVPIPCDLTLTSVKDQDEFIGLGFLYDLTSIKKISQDLNEQSELLKLLNNISTMLLESDISHFEDRLLNALSILGKAMDIDRICIWKNFSKDNSLYCTLYNVWVTDSSLESANTFLKDFPYNAEVLHGWEEKLSAGECIEMLLRDMSPAEQVQFRQQGVLSAFLVPVLLNNTFWGFIDFDGCFRERIFKPNEVTILRSASRSIANTIIRNDTTMQLEFAVDEANEANRVKNVAINSLESILNGIDAHIYITHPQTGELLFINNHMKKTLNKEEDELIGGYCYKILRGFNRKCDFCPCLKLDENPNQLIIWDDYVEQLKGYIRHSDCYIDWPNGSKVHLQHAVDITELYNAREQAEQSNRSKSLFLSHMSHEIRTPMNAILGITEIQLQREGLSAETREALGRIYESGDLLLNIINDILDLSKIESGKFELIPVKYDIPSLINDTAQLNLLRYESKPILFTLHINENMPLGFIGDELRIKQVLNNVLSNAFKYTEEGKVDFSVFTENDLDSDDNVTLVFRVSDTGQGMTQEQLGRLFEEYTRFNMNTNRTTIGAGLGMNISKRLVELMNGSISVESEYGVGSVFTVRLPQKRSGPEVCGPDLIETLGSFNFKSTAIMKKSQFMREYMPYGSVLVVDDVESNLYVARGMLVPYGLKIQTASSGIEAIENIRNGHVYDIVFMDHMMPQMDGIQATKILRDDGYTNAIVALTANTLIGQEQIFLQNGFDGFISKPIDSRELNTVLNDFIRNKRTPEEIKTALTEHPGNATEPANNGDGGISVTPDGNSQSGDARSEMEAFFIIDAENAVTVLHGLYGKIQNPDDAELNSYITCVHGMKSALANFGEKKLSDMALKLEQAGKERDLAVMATETPFFLNALQSIIIRLKPEAPDTAAEVSGKNAAFLREKMLEIKTACQKFDNVSVRAALNELRKETWPLNVNDALDNIAMHILHSAFKKAAAEADSLLS